MYLPFPIFVKSDNESLLIVNASLKSGSISVILSARLSNGLAFGIKAADEMSIYMYKPFMKWQLNLKLQNIILTL